ncbi:MAG: DUF2079 domain-containing protein [Elusimicrobia bacterium]|nr:DUF2079 domain-containing protein [Elusimicrobiota bacterium]
MATDWVRRYRIGLFAVSSILGIFFYASFFLNLRALSEWSGAGLLWGYQLFHNCISGRPLQSSVFATMSTGVVVGFSHNPYAFIHNNVIHANYTPFLFAYFWALHPTPAALYAILFSWNVVGTAVFAYLILRQMGPRDLLPKALFAWSILLGSGLLSILDQLAHLLMFAGPLYLAAYYFFRAKRPAWFMASIAAICLVAEDAAIVAAAFGVYGILFEPDRKGYAWSALLFSACYFLLVILVVQPAARADLALVDKTTAGAIGKRLFELKPKLLLESLWSMCPAFTLLPAFFMAAFLAGWPQRPELKRIAALALLPALPHWGESVVVGGAHHLHPPFMFAYLALLRMLGGVEFPAGPELSSRRMKLLAGATAVFFLGSMRVQAGNLPNRLRPALLRLAGKAGKARALERSLAVEIGSNREVVRVARSLAQSSSLSFWTNNRAAGLLGDRSDLWQFPDFFDQTDYLLIQKDALDLIYAFDPPDPGGLRELFAKNIGWPLRGSRMSEAMLAAVRDALVSEEKTHWIALENEHVLLLERIRKKPFQAPPETVGFGWVRNIGRAPRGIS